MMQNWIRIVFVLLAIFALQAKADPINPILKAEIDQEVAAPPIANTINTDVKQKRNYPMQPPLIPHQIRDYQVNTNVNKCMSCHSRSRTQESQAPMVSVTHFMDRDGNFLAEISPRRYFCTQCHVTQTDAKPLVENTFVDIDSLTKKSAKE